MSRKNQQDFCVICSDPFKLGEVNKEKLVVHKINCAFSVTRGSGGTRCKSYTIKNVLSTIYNVGSLWEDNGGEDNVGACPTCAQVLTNLFIFYEKVNQLRKQESLLSQMMRVLEQITPKMNQGNQNARRLPNKFNQIPRQPSKLMKVNDGTGQSQKIKKLQEIPEPWVCFKTVPRPQMMKKLKQLTEQSELSKKSENVQEQSGNQNESIDKSSSLGHIQLDHDYMAPPLYKRVIYDQSRPPVPIQKEPNQRHNEQNSLTSTSSTMLKNSTSDENENPLTSLSSTGKKMDDRRQEDDDVDISTPCDGPEDNDQDDIIIEKVIVPPSSAAATSVSTSQKSIESKKVPLNEDDDIEIKTEFMTCDTCQKIFIFEKNLKAHRKICKLRRKIIYPHSLTVMVTTRPRKSPGQMQQQQEQQQVLDSTENFRKRKTPPSLHLPTIRKQLDVLATPGKSIVCSMCKKKFDNTDDCIVHLSKTHFPFKCRKCRLIFSTTMDFDIHMATTHARIRITSVNPDDKNTKMGPKIRKVKVRPVLQCDKCPKSFTTKWNLKSHSRTHEPKEKKVRKKYQRKVKIGEKSISKETVEEADDIQYNWTTWDHKCTICGKDMGNRIALAAHVKTHWAHQCSSCRKRFQSAEELSGHTPHCDRVQRPIRCTHGDPPCGREFPTQYRLAFHIRVQHIGERTFMCHVCGKKFIWNTDLTRHLKGHMGIRPFVCTFEGCDKAYFNRANLRDHLNTHQGIKGHLCTVCGRGYSKKYLLDVHTRVQHTGDLKFVCPVCPKKFPLVSYQNAHFKRCHGDRPNKCPTCGKGFSTNQLLTKHLKCHANCPICDLAFTNLKKLKAHVRTHDAESDNVKRVRRKIVQKDEEGVSDDDQVEDEEEAGDVSDLDDYDDD